MTVFQGADRWALEDNRKNCYLRIKPALGGKAEQVAYDLGRIARFFAAERLTLDFERQTFFFSSESASYVIHPRLASIRRLHPARSGRFRKASPFRTAGPTGFSRIGEAL